MYDTEIRLNRHLPALLPAAGLVGGILTVYYLQTISGWVLAGVPAIVGVVLLCMSKRLSIIAFAWMWGALVMINALPKDLQDDTDRTYIGCVEDDVNLGATQKLIVGIKEGGRVAVTLLDYPRAVEEGDSVRFNSVVFSAVHHPTVPDEFDGKRTATVKRLSGRCVVRSDDFEVIAKATGFQKWVNDWRVSLRRAIFTSGVNQQTATFLLALLLGDNRLDAGMREDFSRAGVAHVLALSGTHVSFITLFISILFFPIMLARGKRGALLAIASLLWIYAILTGLSPSVVRSVTMATVCAVGLCMDKKIKILNALLISAVFMLAVSPEQLFSIGFELSFLAVAGIGMFFRYMTVPVLKQFPDHFKLATVCWSPITMSLSAMIGTAMLSVYYFHQFPVYFLVANILAACLLPVIMGGGIMLTLLSVCGVYMGWLATILDWSVKCIVSVAGAIGFMPRPQWAMAAYPDALTVVLVYTFIVLVWLAISNRKRILWWSGGVVLTFAVASAIALKPSIPERESFVWESRKGSCFLVRESYKVVIFSGAPRWQFPQIQDEANSTLGDYLQRRGAKIESVVEIDSLSGYGSSNVKPLTK